jgi:polyribonucleotide nucleotidyltransferase
MHTKVSFELSGNPYVLETGQVARQAGGSVMVRQGDTMVLVTAVSGREDPDRGWFPLMVEYREKFYAAGKIPGGFFKREARPTEKETLTCRLVDRPIRPLFPDGFMAEVQVVAFVVSYDGEHEPDTLAITGASAALNLSDIPFGDVIAGVRVTRIDGEFKANPSAEEALDGDLDLIVAGSDTAILMVEGTANEIPEDVMIDAINFAHDRIREINASQRELFEKAGCKEKRSFTVPAMPEGIEEAVTSNYSEELNKLGRNDKKKAREADLNDMQKRVVEELAEKFPEQESWIGKAFRNLEKKLMRDMILDESLRADGRKLDEVRNIEILPTFLPRSHGSALFTRGETQAMVSLTLGTSRDEQRIDSIEGEYFKRFMLHYNFPGFSVGETSRMFTSRREIGHGNLAERALRPMIPSEDGFPYTLRIVSDITESNGSSSMASVCGGSIALMDGGVPMTGHVAGVAMGLVTDGERFRILTDIQGLEDHLGDMDFKVTGSAKGITAFQLDTKIEGLPREIMEQALQQAEVARKHILDVMNESLSESRPELSPYAPKITSIKVPKDKIRDIIGKGGATIRRIQEETGATIEVEDDGTVKVAAINQEGGDAALEWIGFLTAEAEVGKVYDGKVKDIVKFGAFVEILPGKDGLLHISEIANERIDRVEDVLTVGEHVQVKVIEVDSQGKVRLSRRVLLDSDSPAETR